MYNILWNYIIIITVAVVKKWAVYEDRVLADRIQSEESEYKPRFWCGHLWEPCIPVLI